MGSAWSSSQLKSFDGCRVRWGFARLQGWREEQGVNAGRGTAVHAQLERWYGRKNFEPVRNDKGRSDLRAFLPALPEACALMTYVGNVDMLVEVPLSFTRKAAWIGFIDGVVFEGDTVYLIDWKTTGNIQYAMNENELREDVAANLYAYEAFEGGAERVCLRWIYIEFGSQTPRETRIWMDRTDVYAKVGEYDDRAEFGNKLKAAYRRGLLNVLDLPKDKSHCFDYRAECTYKGICKPESDRRPLMLKGRNQMATSFENQVNDVTGGERKAPPAIPGKKGPPALPGKKPPSPVAAAAEHFSGDAPVEGGTFNAPKPEGVKALAATPEEAAKNQDIKAPVDVGQAAPGDAQDDLDGMDVAQLKALATALGIDFTPKARAATVIGLIRSKRQHEAAESGEAITDTDFAPETESEAKTVEQIQREVADSIKGEVPGNDAPVVEKLAKVVEIKKAAAAQEVDADGDAVESDAGYVLYIGCRPEGHVTELSALLGRFTADLKQATGASDYRAIDFGKGKGIIAEALVDEVEQGRICGSVVLDIRTPEGAEFCGVLERGARSIVRAF